MKYKSAGLYSPLITDMVVKDVVDNTFRGAANNICEYTGEYISSTTVWNITQRAGQFLEDENVN